MAFVCDVCAEWLRKPVSRAVSGETKTIKEKNGSRRCCGTRCRRKEDVVQNDETKSYDRLKRGKKIVHILPEQLAIQHPNRLEKKRSALAAVPYCSALSVGIACTTLIALVVVNFDDQTTTEWLIAAVVSALVGWITEPLKGVAIAASTVLALDSCRKKRTLQDAVRLATVQKSTASLFASNRQSDSAITIQRYWRGYATRKRFQNELSALRESKCYRCGELPMQPDLPNTTMASTPRARISTWSLPDLPNVPTKSTLGARTLAPVSLTTQSADAYRVDHLGYSEP
eukprot:SAG31_NODE_369_length_16731_cov_36.453283_9_plen_286_part_00